MPSPWSNLVQRWKLLRLKKKLNRLSLENCPRFIPSFRWAKVIKVYDGDTITLGTWIHGSSFSFSFRLARIDTPELRTSNPEEKEQGYTVRNILRTMILNKIVLIDNISYDKYGRLLGEVFLGSTNINSWLLENNYARSYDGGKKRPWNISFMK